jgi:hypothetical protein
MSSVFTMQQQIHVTLTKFRLFERPTPVIVLQTLSIPLSQFTDHESKLDLKSLREIDFFFGGEKAGKAVLDDIGFH